MVTHTKSSIAARRVELFNFLVLVSLLVTIALGARIMIAKGACKSSKRSAINMAYYAWIVNAKLTQNLDAKLPPRDTRRIMIFTMSQTALCARYHCAHLTVNIVAYVAALSPRCCVILVSAMLVLVARGHCAVGVPVLYPKTNAPALYAQGHCVRLTVEDRTRTTSIVAYVAALSPGCCVILVSAMKCHCAVGARSSFTDECTIFEMNSMAATSSYTTEQLQTFFVKSEFNCVSCCMRKSKFLAPPGLRIRQRIHRYSINEGAIPS